MVVPINAEAVLYEHGRYANAPAMETLPVMQMRLFGESRSGANGPR